MKPKRTISVNLRVNNIPDEMIESIKRKATIFRNDVATIMSDVEESDDVYYDFNVTDSEWIDPEYDDPEYMTPRRRRPRRIG